VHVSAVGIAQTGTKVLLFVNETHPVRSGNAHHARGYARLNTQVRARHASCRCSTPACACSSCSRCATCRALHAAACTRNLRMEDVAQDTHAAHSGTLLLPSVTSVSVKAWSSLADAQPKRDDGASSVSDCIQAANHPCTEFTDAGHSMPDEAGELC
jgi:hypothetical protein